MNESIALLSATAISIGFVHTILGPDHYLPFIVLSEAKKWTLRKRIYPKIDAVGHKGGNPKFNAIQYPLV